MEGKAPNALFEHQATNATTRDFFAHLRQGDRWIVREDDQTLGDTSLARLSAQVGPVIQQAQAGGKHIVDHAFWKGVLAMGIALVFALTYRFLGPRLTPATRSATHSP
jgi:hypothetical protein